MTYRVRDWVRFNTHRNRGPGVGGERDPLDITDARKVLDDLAAKREAAPAPEASKRKGSGPVDRSMPAWLVAHCQAILDAIRKGY